MRKTLFETQVLTGFQYMEGVGYVVQIAPAPFELEVGETYIIELDGDREFSRTAFAFDSFSPGMIAVGNDYPVTGQDDPDGLPVIIGYDPAADYVAIAAFVEVSELMIGIYQEVEEKIILRDPDGTEQEYPMRSMLEVDTTEGGTVLYSKGQILDGLTIQLDFSDGDMEITAPDGYLVQSAVIAKPENLKPENIAKNEVVAGIEGTHEGGGSDVPCLFNAQGGAIFYDYNMAVGHRSTNCLAYVYSTNAEIKSVRCFCNFIGASSASSVQSSYSIGITNNAPKTDYTISVGTSYITVGGAFSVYCGYRYGMRFSRIDVSFVIPGVTLKETESGITLHADSTVSRIQQATIERAADIKMVDWSESLIDVLYGRVFWGCTNLSRVILPSTIKTVWGDAFEGLESSLNGLVIDLSRCTAVPTGYNLTNIDGIPNLQVLIPAALYDEWIAATNWATIADYIVAV